MLLAASTSTIDTTDPQVCPRQDPRAGGAPAGVRLADLDELGPPDPDRQYAIELTRWAVARYDEAVRQQRAVNEARRDSLRWDHWQNLTATHLDLAEAALLATIMGWNATSTSALAVAALCRWNPPQGIQIDGRQFLAIPQYGAYPGDVSDRFLMTLVVIDKGAFRDLGGF